MNQLKQKYIEEILPQLQKDLKIQNLHAVPQIKKVILNVGVSEPQHQDKALKSISEQFELMTGQHPKIAQARKSIAGFKLREGDPIGVTVTLRGEKMYQFLQKLIGIVLPRVKDFQGVSVTAFDGSGNYSLGIREQIVFPEIDYDKIDSVRGLQVNIVTSTQNDEHARKLLTLLGMPFAKEE